MLFKVFATPITQSEVTASAPFRLLSYLIDGNAPTKAEPQLIEAVFSEEQNPVAYRTGMFQLGNYIFDFKPFLTEFLVKTKTKGHEKVYSISVDWAIKTSKNPDDIIEIKTIN